MARRRPTFICPSSTAVSTPGRPLAAQYRTPSAPWVSSRGSGVTTLPRDFDIFLRSGSRTHPEMAASVQGRQPCSSSAAHDGAEQPGPDDLVRLGAQVHGEHPGEEVGVVAHGARRSAG